MINRIGEDIAAGDDSVDELEGALDALLDYARTHFADEESIMQEQQVAAGAAGAGSPTEGAPKLESTI